MTVRPAPSPGPAPAAPILSSVTHSAAPGALALFRAFHADLLAGCAQEQAPAGSVAERLVSTLHGMSAAASARGPAAHGTVVKAVFAMAMLADRALAQTKPADAVVAGRLFGANATLQTLFVQADDLIRQGAKADRELAAVYLSALALGFPDDSQAAARRPQLHRIVAGRDGGTERPQAGLASPRAYDPPAGAIAGSFRPSSRRWWWAVGGTAALFLLVSHLLWSAAVNDLQRDLRGARAAVEDMGLSWSY
ncbi:hypothetical protein ABMY26_01225 [Azospirillum sp. HJ39]|uniref:DotU family type IV/VI secretion system protein n=1 Tax=Azospirillum sp. HJ39 TaxID=3159496 RepID=UPI0035592B6E